MGTRSEIEKAWEHAGFRCVVLAHRDIGFRCGYVGVPVVHPLYGVNYGAAGECNGAPSTPEAMFEVHGGLTYSNGSGDYPAKAEGLWWFGFDCGHAEDAPDPAISKGPYKNNICRIFMERLECGEIRTLDYVIAECESLAKQLRVVYYHRSMLSRLIRKAWSWIMSMLPSGGD